MAYGLAGKKFGTLGFTSDGLKELKISLKEFKSLSKIITSTGGAFKNSIKDFKGLPILFENTNKQFKKSLSEYINKSSNLILTKESIIDINKSDSKLKKIFDNYNNNRLLQFRTGDEKLQTQILDEYRGNDLVNKYLTNQLQSNRRANVGSYRNFVMNSDYGKGIQGIITALSNYNQIADKNTIKTAKMTEAQKDFVSTLRFSNPVLASNLEKIDKAQVGIRNLMLATVKTKAIKGILSVISGALNGIVGGLSSMAIMTVVNAIWNALSNFNKLTNEAKENLEDFQNQIQNIEDYIDKIKELKKAQDDAIVSKDNNQILSSNENLLSLQNDIVDSYGTQIKNIDLVNGSLEKELEILEQIKIENSKSFLQSNSKSIEKAQKRYANTSTNSIKTNLFSALPDAFFNDLDKLGVQYQAVKNNNLTAERIFTIYSDATDVDISDVNKKLQGFHDLVEKYASYETDPKISKQYTNILQQIETEINKNKKLIDEFGEFYNDWLSAIALTSNIKPENSDKSANEWLQYENSLIDDYNKAILNNDNALKEKTSQDIQDTIKQISSYDWDNLTDTTSGKKTRGLKKYLISMFDGIADDVDVINAKSKALQMINYANHGNKKVLNFNKSDLEVLNDLKSIQDFSKLDISNDYERGLLQLQDIMSVTGISAENLLDLLVELGYVKLDASKWTPSENEISTSINNIRKELFGDSDTETSKSLNSTVSAIKLAFDTIQTEGKLTSETISNLQHLDLNDTLYYDSNANEYKIDRNALLDLVKAKYDDLKADTLKEKQKLINNRNQDWLEVQSISDPEQKKQYKAKFDNELESYNNSLNDLSMSLNILEENYNEFLKTLSSNGFEIGKIQYLESQLTTISDIINNLSDDNSLTTENVSTIIQSDFADTLTLDKESNQLTINIEKYKELATAKVQSNINSSQSSLNGLKQEQTQLQNTINQYNSLLNNQNVSSLVKSDIQNSISKMEDKLSDCNSAIKNNELELSLWNNLASKVASSITNSFRDILENTKNLESSANTMSNAFKEVKDNGYLSLSTATSLIDSGYANCVILDKQTKQLTLNATAYKELAKQKINDQLTTLYSMKSTGQNTQQIQAQIQALELLQQNLNMVTTGAYGNTQDYWKAEAEQQFAKLDHLHNMNVLDDTEYYSEMEKLNNKYYKNKIKYLEDYRRYEEEIYKGQFETQKEIINKEKELLDTQKDGWNEQKEALEDSKEYWNDLIDAIDKEIKGIQKEEDYWNDQKDILSDQKDAIQEQIDAINEKNEEEERALKIQEAQLKLQNALNQKNVRVFSEELGWQWETNQNDVKSAQQELDELLKENETAELEKQIKDIETQEKEIDNIIKSLNKQIDSLEDEKENYNDEIDLIDDNIKAIEKEISAIEKQEEILDKQISAIEKQSESPNYSHVDEFSNTTDKVNNFTKMSQEEINQILGLPIDFNTSLTTNIKEPIESLKNAINPISQTLDSLKADSSLNDFGKNTNWNNQQNVSVNINQVNTQNASDFIDQLGTILTAQLK